MNNSEKKYDSLGCILAAAMLAALINKDFSTNEAEADETKEKSAKDVHDCNGNCKNKCKSCKENNTGLDMELIKSKYEEVKNHVLFTDNPIFNLMAYRNLIELGEALGIEKE